MVFLPVITLLRLAGPAGEPAIRVLDSDTGITVLVITALTIYMYLGFRRAYGSSKTRAALSSFVLAWAVGFLTDVYHDGLFYITLWTT